MSETVFSEQEFTKLLEDMGIPGWIRDRNLSDVSYSAITNFSLTKFKNYLT